MRLALVGVIVVVAVGCDGADERPWCTFDGTEREYCDEGEVCDVVNDSGCVPAWQLEQCEGLPDGAECELEDYARTICVGEACRPALCGDGFVSHMERCDVGFPIEPRHCVDYAEQWDYGPITCADYSCGLSQSACGRLGWLASEAGGSGQVDALWNWRDMTWLGGEDGLVFNDLDGWYELGDPTGSHVWYQSVWSEMTWPPASSPVVVAVGFGHPSD
jgi:hypothetical protein